MKSYRVTLTVDATTSVNVEAENEEEAKQKALEMATCPGLCRQCSDELDLGDIQEAIAAYEQ